MQTLLTVFTWSGDKETLDRNLPTFEPHFKHVNICSPVDAPSHRGGMTEELSAKYGVSLMKRIRAGFSHCLGTDHDTFCFVEADTICFRALPDEVKLPGAFHCFRYENREPEKFRAKAVTHFPWWMDRATLCRLHKAMLNYDMGIEQGFADRTTAFILEQERIRIVHDWHHFYSANSIFDPSHYKDIRRRRHTLSMVHGVKTADQFNRVFDAFNGVREPTIVGQEL